MVPNRPRQNGTSSQQEQPLVERALPSSVRRIHTLEAMEHAITSSAKFLADAQTEFEKAPSYSGNAIKSQIHLARTLVYEALELLHGIDSLMGVNPTQIIQTSTSFTRMLDEIKSIHRVSRRLTNEPHDRHYPRALSALAKKCSRMSKELTGFVEVEIRKAQRDIANATANKSNSLTA